MIVLIVIFLKEACESLSLDHVYISLHGGEPLMQKKADFDAMCSCISFALNDICKVTFSVQTNGTLLDNEWLDILEKHQVHIGISLDGPKEYHDMHRLTKKKKGTYDNIIENLSLLKKHRYYKVKGCGILTVINPFLNARKIYRHFVDELHLDNIDFLIPDYTYDYPPTFKKDALANYFISLFNEWNGDDNPEIRVRLFKNIIDLVLGNKSSIYGFGPSDLDIPLITISSDGDLSPVDELRTANPDMMKTGKSIFNTTLAEFIDLPIFKEIKKATHNIPKNCLSCCWKKVCRGGPILNRYAKNNAFDNPSIYCDDLKKIYSWVASYLVQNGVSFLDIQNKVLN